MEIQQIRSATLKIRYGGLTILVDPWLQDKGTGFSADTVRSEMRGVRSPMNDLPLPVKDILSGVDLCLVTHIHPDHFTEEYLPKGMKIVVQNTEDRERLIARGFTNVEAFEGASLECGPVVITKAPAQHGDSAALAAQMGPVSGYVLEGEERTLYIAGDTVYFDGVARTLERYRPGVAALNCCAATLPAGRLIMDLCDVERVCRQCPEALVIATHLDSVNHALLTSGDVRAFAREKGLSRLRVPANGEVVRA